MSNNLENELTTGSDNLDTLEGSDIRPNRFRFLDKEMIKATEREGGISDYVISTKLDQLSEPFSGVVTKIKKDKIGDTIEDVLDLASELLA